MQLRSLHETLQMNFIAVIESLNCLSESLEHKLCHLREHKTGTLDERVAETKQILKKESAELEQQLRSIRVRTQGSLFLASFG